MRDQMAEDFGGVVLYPTKFLINMTNWTLHFSFSVAVVNVSALSFKIWKIQGGVPSVAPLNTHLIFFFLL